MPETPAHPSRSSAHAPTPTHSSRYDDPFSQEAMQDILSKNPANNPHDPDPFAEGHPLNVLPLDYRNPLSDDAPLAADQRTHWLEERGYDPKAEADLKRSNGEGCIMNGEFVCEPVPGDLDLIRDGIEHDECPDLPQIPKEFNMKPRWESFCRLYAFGHSAADAARHAGYAWGTSKHAGWRLLQDPRIQRRITTLQQFAHAYRPKSREELGVRLEIIYRECMNRGQYHAAVRALDLISRLEGIRPPAQTPKKRKKATGDEVESHINQTENQPENQAG